MLLGRTLDAPLDARGERQARAVARRLRAFAPRHVDSSPRLRTRQTAQAIADAAGCRVRVSPLLDEVDFGDWSGHSFAQLEADPRWRRWNAQRGRARTPGGERMADVLARALRHLHWVARTQGDVAVAVVTHAEVIRALLLHALDAPFDDYHRHEIAPASITWMRLDGDALRIDDAADAARRRCA